MFGINFFDEKQDSLYGQECCRELLNQRYLRRENITLGVFRRKLKEQNKKNKQTKQKVPPLYWIGFCVLKMSDNLDFVRFSLRSLNYRQMGDSGKDCEGKM